VGRKTRTGKARSLTSPRERSLQDANSNTDEERRKKSARAKSELEKSAREGRGRGQSTPANRYRSGKGASVPDRFQKRVQGCAALTEGPERVGVPRVRLSPGEFERGCESVYGAARPPQHRLLTTGALPSLSSQKRAGPPYPLRGTQAAYGPQQGPRQGRGTKGRRRRARLSRHTGSCRIVRLFGPTGG